MAEAAARLDRAALAAGGRVTRALARAALAELPGFGAGDEDAADDLADDDARVGPRKPAGRRPRPCLG